jgi:hypothetical protein
MSEKERMVPGRIYYGECSPNIKIVGRFLRETITQYIFSDYIQYRDTEEHFSERDIFFVRGDIETLREANYSEKMSLVKYEINHNCI